MKIGIVGSGISGLAASWFLNDKYDITLFEKSDYLGGHANTVDVNYEGKKISVDTGFIVYNFRTYHNLKPLFRELNVPIEKSDMSFGVKNLDDGLEYAGSLKGIFAQKKNLFSTRFWGMIFDILKFNKEAIKKVKEKKIDDDEKLVDFIKKLKLGEAFQNDYLFPMAAAIWSCPLNEMKEYPAKTFLQFFYNHGLLTVTDQPQWYTVAKGSREYVNRIVKKFKKKIKLNCEIINCYQDKDRVILVDGENKKYEFDHVIFASHADQTNRIISDKSKVEKDVLSKFKYSKNTAILHRDEKQMPKNKKAWASWIYLSSKKQNKVSLSYWMNGLQNIDKDYPLFVTLNPLEEIDENKVFGRYEYEHPIFDLEAIKAQKKLDLIQGKRNIWFCGAWTKYGFHEDGLNSAINVVKNFDVEVPWLK
jgi:predicted NAD/FAD-binding protein